jgi:hypothetical protein
MGFSLISDWWEENPSGKPLFRVPFTFSKLQSETRNRFQGTRTHGLGTPTSARAEAQDW